MPPPSHDTSVEDEINLRDYWRTLLRRRLLILGIVFVTAITAAAEVLLKLNIYQAKATLIPLSRSASGLQVALGELGGLLPLGAIGRESPVERLLAILQSRTLAEEVIRRLD